MKERRARRLRPQVRILFGSVYPLGPGKASLIEAVARTGSISSAAREIGMSYRRAWQLIEATNRCFRAPVVETSTGGRGGGGARITPFGRKVLERYREIERKAIASVQREVTAFARHLADLPPQEETAPRRAVTRRPRPEGPSRSGRRST
jgi:molybdate transport system regulatory protein